ncbi:hypothetical protein ACFL6M_03615 [Candidatus Eisenbacteria bacterium]|uniref:Uncharacterized protein n=1 Tax=Eiseniibacteriota bacterium TaxID=2212470 RepID=A0ABV6YK33_UNCEI
MRMNRWFSAALLVGSIPVALGAFLPTKLHPTAIFDLNTLHWSPGSGLVIAAPSDTPVDATKITVGEIRVVRVWDENQQQWVEPDSSLQSPRIIGIIAHLPNPSDLERRSDRPGQDQQ